METVRLECPKCGFWKRSPLDDDFDPPGTVLVKLTCPDCNQGDFASPTYFDAQGKELCGDPETFKR